MNSAAFRRPPDKGGASPRRAGGWNFRPPDKGGASAASRGLEPRGERFLDFHADRLELLRHFRVGEADYLDAFAGEGCGSRSVTLHAAILEMTVSVELDDKTLRRTVEIRDVMPERLLTREFVGQTAQEFVPELAFGWREITPQLPRSGFEPVLVGDVASAHASFNAHDATRHTAANPPLAKSARSPLVRGAEPVAPAA